MNKRSLAHVYCIQAFGKSVKCFEKCCESVVNYVSRVLKNEMKVLLLVRK